MKPGLVWIPRGMFRPFVEYREIMKGRNKGKLEITLSKHKVIIDKDSVRRWPVK